MRPYDDLYKSFARTTKANEDNHDSLVAIRSFLSVEMFDAARECWDEVGNDDQKAIWIATSKGGWFTPRERAQMKSWKYDWQQLQHWSDG